MENSEQENFAYISSIRVLNDEFRTTGQGGVVVITPGIEQLGVMLHYQIMQSIRTFNCFNKRNDPHNEHDFGAITVAQETVFWKIDYYDIDKVMGSQNPADADVTARVMTVMLGCEY